MTGKHTHGVTTHSVVNCIMDTITVKDSAGGMSFRGINLIANNIDIQGVNQDMTSPGGITIGEYEGGPNGDGNPDSVEHNFGNVIINNFKIENMAEPIHLDGSVETLIVSNGQIKQIEEEKNAIRVFARRLGHVKMRDVIIDSTATPDNSFTWCISFWEWSETLAERGVIDIQGMTFIHPRS